MKKGLKRYFITGLLVMVPLYITVYVLTLIVGFMDNIFNILPMTLRPDTYLPVRIPGQGIVFTVIGIFIVGVIATNILGKRLFSIGERMLLRVPILRIVYNATKQFMETFFSDERDGFRKVVLVEFPRKGVYSLGFVTGRAKGEFQSKVPEGSISVFMPTAPNPTSGFLIIIEEADVIPMDMSVEDAFKVVMTGGMVVPPGVASHGGPPPGSTSMG
ncbi:MAG: hypothetical protein A2W38_00180 [Deltaproteobacteria bacterium RBG_19FT_COMBO_58_16]|nr:MAG: hypothetical protein A2W38_00180 [Deltaproteobacteria bacterium RBG_19FT_COMBO_58_16]